MVLENWVNVVSHKGVPQGGAKDGALINLVVDGERGRVGALCDCGSSAGFGVGREE